MTSAQPVVIAYDGSESAKQAIVRAGELLGARPAHVVTAWDRTAPGAPLAGGVPVYLPEIEEELEKQAREIVEQGAELARAAGFEVVSHTPSDPPLWRAIVDLADEVEAAVIVVGARGLTGVKSLLIGSTSNAVVHHTSRPVLVVHGP